MYAGRFPGAFDLARMQLAKRQKVCSFRTSRFVALQTASEKQGIPNKIVVEVVIDLGSKLGDDVRIGRRRHYVSMQSEDAEGQQVREYCGRVRGLTLGVLVEQIGSERRSNGRLYFYAQCEMISRYCNAEDLLAR